MLGSSRLSLLATDKRRWGTDCYTAVEKRRRCANPCLVEELATADGCKPLNPVARAFCRFKPCATRAEEARKKRSAVTAANPNQHPITHQKSNHNRTKRIARRHAFGFSQSLAPCRAPTSRTTTTLMTISSPYSRRCPEDNCPIESGRLTAVASVCEDVYRAQARATVGQIMRRACLNLVNRPWRLAGVRWAKPAASSL